MKFNLLFIHGTGRFSGAEESLLNLACFLDREKFNPFFILPEEGRFSSKLRDSGIKVFIAALPKIRKVCGVMRSGEEILAIAREKSSHLIHANSIRTNLYGAYVAKRMRIPIVWHERNLITSELVDLDRFFSFLPDKIICNSNAIAQRFVRKGKIGQKIAVIHNGVDIERFNPAISGDGIRKEFGFKSEEIIIGIAGRLGPEKGLETFLNSAKIILSQHPESTNVRFLIVGDAVFPAHKWMEEHLKRVVKDLNIVDQVVFTGFRDDMPWLYAAMNIFVLASDAEACGRVIFEAMATALPVVATDSGGTPEIVLPGVTGLLFAPKDSQKLAEGILYLIRNKETAKKMGLAGRERIEKFFTIEKNVRETQEIYLKLLSAFVHQ